MQWNNSSRSSERIEALEDAKAVIAGDIRDIFAEVKSNGLDVKSVRELIRMRKVDREETLALYMDALGMLAGTPLGDAAMRRAANS
jgi:uncharacterized protein (UPF0335 family)